MMAVCGGGGGGGGGGEAEGLNPSRWEARLRPRGPDRRPSRAIRRRSAARGGRTAVQAEACRMANLRSPPTSPQSIRPPARPPARPPKTAHAESFTAAMRARNTDPAFRATPQRRDRRRASLGARDDFASYDVVDRHDRAEEPLPNAAPAAQIAVVDVDLHLRSGTSTDGATTGTAATETCTTSPCLRRLRR